MHHRFRQYMLICLWISLAATLVPVGAAWAENHVVDVQDNFFSPSTLTIRQGDTVTWRNLGVSAHNVNAPGQFRCANGCDGEGGNGNASASAWQFTRTFNDVETISYRCDPHFAIGMTGTLIVEAGASANNGTLAFDSATTAVDEDAGQAAVGVRRSGGTDGAVSADFTTSDGSAVAGLDYTAVTTTVSFADGEGGVKTVTIPILDDAESENTEIIVVALASPSGGATIGVPASAAVRILDDDQASPGALQFTSPVVTGSETDGQISLEVERTGGSDGAVSVSYAASSGSAEEGSDFQTTTGQLDWGDGDTSNQQIDVPVTDDSEEEGVETFSVALSNPTGGASLGAQSTATVTLTDDDATGCVPSATTLCLGAGSRFGIDVDWRIFDGSTGVGQTIDIDKTDSGLFFFFDENNAEVLIKVLDGCAINGHYWVFFAATTDVEFSLTVTDTQTATSRTYVNPLGQPANAVTDTSALEVCP